MPAIAEGERGDVIMPFSIPMALPMALLSSQVLVAAADRIPNLNFAPTCRNQTDPSADNIKQCMENERLARKMLGDEWSKYSRQVKADCFWETKLDKSPSYINLLTCLSIDENARKSPKMYK
jgi:hypothetical protein